MVNIPNINSPDPEQQKQLRLLLDRLKSTDVGLSQAVQALEKIDNGMNSNDEFFWLMVLENQVKVRYSIQR